jgi:hypothetical protein
MDNFNQDDSFDIQDDVEPSSDCLKLLREIKDIMAHQRQEHELTGSVLLTNVRREERDLILQAARDTGFRISISDEAYSQCGQLVPNCIGVYTFEWPIDHSSFWNRVKELEGRA